MYRRILVPVDGSPASRLGLDEAIRLARVTGATLRLVHVVNEYVFDPVYAPVFDYAPLLESFRLAGEKVLTQAQATVRAAGVEFQSELVETLGGSVARLILDQAENWPAELIVMGTHGRRGVSRVVLGSDAEAVLRAAPCPVLLVRQHAAS
jgi:nucleotide-binding universal stress UspA family protein